METELRNSLMNLHPASFAWAMVCCGDRELAEDVLQSVYVKVLDGHRPYEGRSSFRTWLFTVIRNAARDQRRRRRWSRVLQLESESPFELAQSPDGGNPRVDEDDELAIVRAALGKLPQRQRQVAQLVFYEDLTIAADAERSGR